MAKTIFNYSVARLARILLQDRDQRCHRIVDARPIPNPIMQDRVQVSRPKPRSTIQDQDSRIDHARLRTRLSSYWWYKTKTKAIILMVEDQNKNSPRRTETKASVRKTDQDPLCKTESKTHYPWPRRRSDDARSRPKPHFVLQDRTRYARPRPRLTA